MANNDQIIKGIAGGAASAMNPQIDLLREQNELLRRLLEKETGITTEDIFRSVQQKDADYRKITGHGAFAYETKLLKMNPIYCIISKRIIYKRGIRYAKNYSSK